MTPEPPPVMPNYPEPRIELVEPYATRNRKMVARIEAMTNEELDRLVDADQCPYEPEHLIGVPLGMFHCPLCGDMIVAGLRHGRWSDFERALAAAEQAGEIMPWDRWYIRIMKRVLKWMAAGRVFQRIQNLETEMTKTKADLDAKINEVGARLDDFISDVGGQLKDIRDRLAAKQNMSADTTHEVAALDGLIEKINTSQGLIDATATTIGDDSTANTSTGDTANPGA